MPGWIFVTVLLAAATLLAAIADRGLVVPVILGVVTLISGVAGALLRPDRGVVDRIDDPPR